jgi:hypothetical protein
MSIGTRFNPFTGQVDFVENNELNLRTRGLIYDDFNSRLGTLGYLGWVNTNVGATWSVTAANPTNTFNTGVYRQQITHTGAATATSVTNLGTVGNIRLTDGEIQVEAFVRVENLPAQITARQYWIGFQDTQTVTPSNAVLIGFTQQNTAVAPWWEIRTINATATTTTAVNTAAVVANTWTHLRFVVTADGAFVNWFVNGTLVSVASSNIPLGTVSMFPAFWLQSTSNAAAAAYGHNIDFYKLTKLFNPLRF